jgi:hypothetical protein
MVHTASKSVIAPMMIDSQLARFVMPPFLA